MPDRGFQLPRVNERAEKPRTRGLTEIRGPYCTPLGKRYLQDALECLRAGIWGTAGTWGRMVTYKDETPT